MPEYQLWKEIRGRCRRPTHNSYARFGALGIRVCEAWDKSFDAFMADMGPRPDGMNSAELIDPRGNYEPGNCRWGTTRILQLAERQDVTADYLRRRYSYDPNTGHFTRIAQAMGARLGERVGYINGQGYVVIRIGNKHLAAHRLAWLYVYGEWPKDQIDHINRDKADNRIANLRDVDHCGNMQNAVTGPKTRTGVRGVAHHPTTGKFAAYISRNRKKVWLGVFPTVEEAAAVRARAELEFTQ